MSNTVIVSSINSILTIPSGLSGNVLVSSYNGLEWYLPTYFKLIKNGLLYTNDSNEHYFILELK